MLSKSLLKLHPKQHDVFHHRARFKVVAAGRRWGKSMLSQVSLIDNASAKPGSLNWYVAPSYRMAKQIMWTDMNRRLPPAWISRRNETFMRFELINGSVIELKGADKEDSLRGVGLDHLVLDEMQDMRPGVWKTVLRPTLATTRGSALFIGTSKSFNHFYDVWLRGMEGDGRIWKSWQFPTSSSPFVPDEEIEQARSDMDPKTFRQEFEASFEAMSGRVYHTFDRKVHVGDHPFNPKLPIYIGQDFNIDPMSSAIFQIQENGEIWAVDEIVLFSSNTQEVCEEIERRYWRHTKQIIVYPDPAGGARQHARGETDLDIFREKGFKRIKYHRKHPPVADRVNAVNKMLLAANGEIRMKVNRKCRHLIDSLEQTIYKEGGREIDKSLSIEHITDAAGYFIQYEFPARRIEIMGVSI
ncbi:MAG: terminase large subunit domain-containing protein [Candidatus Binatia bacterium]